MNPSTQGQNYTQRRYRTSRYEEPPLSQRFTNLVVSQLRIVFANPPRERHQERDHPQTDQRSRTPDVRDLDLDLKSRWFANSPATFPPRTIDQDKINYATTAGWEAIGSRERRWFTAAIRSHSTLAVTKIYLTWNPRKPGGTVTAKQKHYPPPRRLGSQELEAYRARYGNGLASWCESKKGQRVGSGICGDLASEALKAIAARCTSRREEPCLVTQCDIQGYLIYHLSLPLTSPQETKTSPREAGVGRGDLIQMLSAHFLSKDGSQKLISERGHVAVVTRVRSNGALVVLEQNVKGVKVVVEGEYNMLELVKGEVQIFRAVAESWLSKLDPSW